MHEEPGQSYDDLLRQLNKNLESRSEMQLKTLPVSREWLRIYAYAARHSTVYRVFV